MGHGAEEGATDFLPAGAHQADEAEQLALANVEVDRARPRRLEAAHDDPGRPWRAVPLVEEFEVRAADDEASELVGIGVAHRFLADEARPSRITTTRSAIRKISSRRCET
jgi:hypothetical protein